MSLKQARAQETDPELGMLPRWDLTDLYPARDSGELKTDIEKVITEAEAFQARYESRVADLTAQDLGTALESYESLEETVGRLGSYADLVYAEDMSDPESARFYQSIQETATRVSTLILFFRLELNGIDDDALEALFEEPRVARYRPWVQEVRALRDYQLSAPEERLLQEKSVTGRAAWTRLFDETFANLRFSLEGEELTSPEILDRLSSPDAEVREKAAKRFGEVLGENSRLFTLITNTLAKDKGIEDRLRGFARPVSSRNIANAVEDEVVDALVTSVTQAFPRLSHRYYALKARWMGLEKLPYWDRNAPLPDADDRRIPWQEAQERVLAAYRDFSPELAGIGQRFFDNSWIDAPTQAGKAPGAFAHSTVPSAHPYLLLNYQGRVRDVMTLAHELGHGCHQVLAAGQGHLLSQTPLTLAETASVFGEMLTFRSLLADTTSAQQRRVMLAGKVEDMLNTVVRQVTFHNFETRVHAARREGELLSEDLNRFWMETQEEALGPVFFFDENYGHYWSYVPHFIHVPFYVYAYAFGDCLVNSLYAVYQDAEEGFAARYLEMLSQGGSKRHGELLQPFGLDARDPDFWSRGLKMIEGMIDELEALS